MEFRWSFNVTLLIAGVFGLASGGSNSFVTLASLLAVLGIGVGGNLPVDSAVFLGRKAIRFNHLTFTLFDSRLRCRFCSRIPSVLVNRSLDLVVCRTALRKPGVCIFFSQHCDVCLSIQLSLISLPYRRSRGL